MEIQKLIDQLILFRASELQYVRIAEAESFSLAIAECLCYIQM